MLRYVTDNIISNGVNILKYIGPKHVVVFLLYY